MLKSTSLAIASIIFTLIMFEIVFRFLPVQGGIDINPVNSDHPFINFSPNRDFTYSIGGSLNHPNHGHINNYGFTNDHDYDASDLRPLLAVIGDSYIEAFIVPYKLTVQGRLDQRAGRERRVYSFGASGASLIDYLYYADYVSKTFKAQYFVINIVNNDFDEMLFRYKQVHGLHYFAERADGTLFPILMDYRQNQTLRFLADNSALFRYLAFNVGSTPFGYGIRQSIEGAMAFIRGIFIRSHPVDQNNTLSEASAGHTTSLPAVNRVEISKRAVQSVLDEFPIRTGMPPSRILFLVDSYRLFAEPALAEARNSYFGVMRTYFIEEARRRGFEVQDMQDWFALRYARDHSAFQFPDDGHWNPIGHEEAANAVLGSRPWQTFQKVP